MMSRTKRISALVPSLALGIGILSAAPSAQAVSFDISWTGANNWSMSGMFSYDDSLINTGAITGNDLDSLMFEVFDNQVSQGVWNLGDPGNPLNFNFDTTTETFVVGGNSAGLQGQVWGAQNQNFPAGTVGFASGNGSQLVYVDGRSSGNIRVRDSTLTAIRSQTEVIPTPALLPGLIGMAAAAIRKREQESA